MGGIADPEEAAIEYDVGEEATTGVETGVSSAEVSKADGEGDTKLSFFFQKLFLAPCISSDGRRAWLLLDGNISLVPQGQFL